MRVYEIPQKIFDQLSGNEIKTIRLRSNEEWSFGLLRAGVGMIGYTQYPVLGTPVGFLKIVSRRYWPPTSESFRPFGMQDLFQLKCGYERVHAAGGRGEDRCVISFSSWESSGNEEPHLAELIGMCAHAVRLTKKFFESSECARTISGE